MKFIDKVKSNPKYFYAFGIAATWAGAGSLIVGMKMVQQFGVIPFLLWAIGNTLACIVFGLLANRFPYLRKVFMSKPAKIVIGLMCFFQIWTNMSGVHDALSGINSNVAIIGTYALAVVFMIMYLKKAMLRNVITDDGSWKIVYVLIFALAFVSMAINGVSAPALGTSAEGLASGAQKMITLIPGAFLYPTFWALFDYNEKNEDGTQKVDMKKCFVMGGLLFGAYLVFVFLLAITSFTPALEIVKSILIAIVAASSLTSFIYAMYISFGKKLGAVMNVGAFAGWYFLIPLGVMNIWTAMQNIRICLVFAAIIIAFVWRYIDAKNAVRHKDNGGAETEKLGGSHS